MSLIPSLPNPLSPGSPPTTNITSRIDQCKVVWYRWDYQIQDDISAFGIQIPNLDLGSLSSATAFDISAHVIDVTYTKALSEGAGSFTLTLSNSMDWSKFMKPGEWLNIFMSPDGDLNLAPPNSVIGSLISSFSDVSSKLTSFTTSVPGLFANPSQPPIAPMPTNVNLKGIVSSLRCIGLIQRVGTRTSVDENGAVDISYTISGKDIGVCIEETELWFNYLYMEKSKFDSAIQGGLSLQGARKLKDLMSTWFDAFLAPQKIFSSDLFLPNSIGDTFKQWLLPQLMLTNLGLSFSGDSFFGNIQNLKEFHDTLFENNMASPLSGLEGIAWSKLKMLSQPEFHEFFLEVETSGQPTVFFRPIPWAINKQKYPNIGRNIMQYIELTGETTPLGSLSSAVTSAQSAFANPLSAVSSITQGLSNFRQVHNVDINSSEDIYSFEIGPDFHSRYNHFLVTPNSSGPRQNPLVASQLTDKKILDDFPFKNVQSIRRHGFKPRHLEIWSYLNKSNVLDFTSSVTDDPQVEFLIEANELIRDYWGQTEDFYSGTFVLAGREDVKLGKVLVTDDSVNGAANMIFYIEGYTDHYATNNDGAGEWSQTVIVTHGTEIADLKSKSNFKKKSDLKKVGSFIKR